MKCYRDLDVWRQGIDLVTEIYVMTRNFPREERYALGSQMQRAAVSVPANIAEGHARFSRKEFLHFLSISLGSLAELDTHLTIAHKLDYIPEDLVKSTANLMDSLGRRIRNLQKSLQKKVDQS